MTLREWTSCLVASRCPFGDTTIPSARAVRARVALCRILVVGLVTWSTACDWQTAEEPRVPTSIIVTPTSATFRAFGEILQLSAYVHDQSGQVMPEVDVMWTSSDASIAAVDTAGVVTAARNGNAVVTARTGSVTGTAAVVVEQAVVQVLVAPTVDSLGAVGDTLRFMAEGRDANGHVVHDAAFSWASSNVSVARVDGSGLVTAIRNGTAVITATAGQASGNATLRVTQSANSVVVSAAVDTIAVGDSLTLTAEAFDERGNAVTDPEFIWSTSDARVADVDPTGLVRGIGEGTASITATSGTAAASAAITVTNPDRAILVALYEATGGIEWRNNRNWMTNAALRDWDGVSVDARGSVRVLDLGNNNLRGPLPAELGNLASLESLNLAVNRLTGPIPPELGELSNLGWLHLGGNELTGAIPPELGSLASLEWLDLGGNALRGLIPRSFLQLRQLRNASFGEGVCIPGTSAFVTWGQERSLHRINYPRPGVVSQTGLAYCNEADVGVLRGVYETTGGRGWFNRAGWHGQESSVHPSDYALEEWYGVRVDSLGRVTGIDLANNGLRGRLPTVLSELGRLTVLKIGGNNLSGRLPQSLVHLRLREFRYADTELCVPRARAFREWLSGIPFQEGTGEQCTVLSDRDILEAFYEATSVRFEWVRADNWLTAAPLEDWHGVSVDADGRVTSLVINANNLSGSLPAELGQLSKLTTLDLAYNRMTGPVPPELGDLANLTVLRITGNNLAKGMKRLANNDLSGPVPPELGELTSLRVLDLGGNDLTGTIPPELGELANLERLDLGGSHLTGPIPPELGELDKLKTLDLAHNRHTGQVPAEFGNLTSLEEMYLGSNDLAGAIPSGIGNLRRLTALDFTDNPELEGSVPFGLTALVGLDLLGASGTGLCAPAHSAFQAWLNGVARRWITPCAPPMAYLTQAVQLPGHSVPLVAGERALLRVFVTASRPTQETLPGVRARFYANGREVHIEEIPGSSTRIPTQLDEGRLSQSANAEIPGTVIQPGLEMVIEVDPAGAVERGLGIPARIPETGRLAIDVRAMPRLDLTLIPFVWREEPDWSIIDLIEEMAEEPESHRTLWATRTLLPVGDMEITAHEPLLTSTTDQHTLLSETWAIRALEGGTGHYMGMMAGTNGGIASMPGRVSFSSPDPETMAHELGHNFNLPHAPCGVEGPWFPHPEGSIGVWGYDFRAGGRLVHPSRPDLMSYCVGAWISDYHFTRAAHYRLADEPAPADQPAASLRKSLLLWGGTGADGVPFLEPAFVTNARAVPPRAGGPYRVSGWTRNGTQLFSFAFDMAAVADGEGSGSSFAFLLPVQSGWEDNLASITLTAPGGTVTLNEDSGLPMVILRNQHTGQIRGILRNLADTNIGQAANLLSPTTGIEVLLSRGIPGIEEWRR